MRPTEAWPLVVVIDEAHTYFAEVKGGDAESRRLAALASENRRLVEDLIKTGRSLGFLTVLATQKATGDAIPTSIRDVCPVAMSFAQTTTAGAVAALREDIRDYPEANRDRPRLRLSPRRTDTSGRAACRGQPCLRCFA